VTALLLDLFEYHRKDIRRNVEDLVSASNATPTTSCVRRAV